MKIYYKRTISDEELKQLVQRPEEGAQEIESIVKSICLEVKKLGDEAVRKYGDLYEPTAVEKFRVDDDEINEANERVTPELRDAIAVAEKNIRKFHVAQFRENRDIQIDDGISCRRDIKPYDAVGLYIPAGSAPLPSTVLMLGVPAKIAGCSRIILCSPPNASGKVDAAILATASHLGIREIYKTGGAQAVAAMAYGTQSIPKVEKIFGPGSRYVMLAKQFVSNDPNGCPVDLIAGPSELLVIADNSARPELVAIDLLSQAEHDSFSQVVLVTTDIEFAKRVVEIIRARIENLSRRKIIERSVANSYALVVDTMNKAIEFTNHYAPEHLTINVRNPEDVANYIKHAGSVFIGEYSPVTAGDYASGTNHTLPTNGSAKWFGGLTVESFQKSITFQTLTKDGLRKLAPTLITFAETEGLEAHKQAVTERLE